MWDFYRDVMGWFDQLDTQEWFMVLLLAMIAGFFCMRGFGSRSNY